MRIEVVEQIDDFTREVWEFNMFGLSAVFVEWRKEEKPQGKRKWFTIRFWDKYARREHSMSDEPALTEAIKSRALSEDIKRVKVQTWDEYKNPN